jgi:polar amino acid transport system permease protein
VTVLSAPLQEQETEPFLGPSDWDWDFAREILPDMAEGLWLTFRLALGGVAIAVVGGLVLALLRRSRFRVIRWPVGFVIEFIRSTPLLVQIFFVFFVLPEFDIVLEPLTAALWTLGVHYATYMSESYRAGIDSVPVGQWEASTALNLSSVTKWREVILPQAVPTVIPALGNYLVSALKDAPVVAIGVGLLDVIGTANDIQGEFFRGTEPFTIAGVLFLALSIPLAIFARFLEKRYGYQRD